MIRGASDRRIFLTGCNSFLKEAFTKNGGCELIQVYPVSHSEWPIKHRDIKICLHFATDSSNSNRVVRLAANMNTYHGHYVQEWSGNSGDVDACAVLNGDQLTGFDRQGGSRMNLHEFMEFGREKALGTWRTNHIN